MKTIAVLTIGQTPRSDICNDFRALLPPDIALTEFGVCDGLSERAIEERFGYRGTGNMLVTRLRNGALVKLSEAAVLLGMQDCITRAEASGTLLQIVACTGVFPAYHHSRPLLFLGSLHRKSAISQAQGAPIGVLVPVAEQCEQIASWWRTAGIQAPLLEVADPFGSISEIVAAAMRLSERGARVLCMDCFGYSLQARDRAAQETKLKIILPREELVHEAVHILDAPH